MTRYELHKRKWTDCIRCDLCKGRTTVVLKRGPLPCDVLFVGEAPGASEDVLGEPFVGPAGHLLDEIIQRAFDSFGASESGRVGYKWAFTNLVGCIPLGEDGDKTAEPPKEAIKACSPRLVELALMAKPKLFVWVGKLAGKYGPQIVLPSFKKIKHVEIIHPAAILRADPSQQPLLAQRAIITLRDAIEEL